MVAGFVTSINSEAGEEEVDLKKLQGDWIVVSVKSEDSKRDADAAGAVIRFDENTWQSFDPSGRQETSLREIKLWPKERPKRIDVIRDGKIQIRGIYDLEKDQLKLCWSTRRDGARPRDFTKAGGKDKIRIIVLDRKSKK
jgi:uncharacterized protein (TIGR03067 family)